MVLQLTSMFGCDNKSRTTSKWPLLEAKCNGVSSIFDLNSTKKVDLNFTKKVDLNITKKVDLNFTKKVD